MYSLMIIFPILGCILQDQASQRFRCGSMESTSPKRLLLLTEAKLVWKSTRVNSQSELHPTGVAWIYFPLSIFIHEITTNCGVILKDLVQLVKRKLPAGIICWKHQRYMAQGLFQNFSNWMNVEHFSRLIRVSNHVQLATLRSHQVFNHTTWEHQSNIK